MPVEWSHPSPQETRHWQLSLWPYRSLLRKDFVLFIGATAALIALPLVAAIGTAVLWGLLPFFALMLSGLWYALHISYRRGEILEELTVDDTTAHLTRHNPAGNIQEWEANRYWISVHIRDDGPVEKYLTLRGNGREVELGAFLTPEERQALHGELMQALSGGR
ncbi:DUF2244 domain-containing protein [Loktanella agnita]|uniref:DUF2244 domain-containing protein n=1 Tax=Loktanella agnita TaxID=287097 RepID=UPI00398816F7